MLGSNSNHKERIVLLHEEFEKHRCVRGRVLLLEESRCQLKDNGSNAKYPQIRPMKRDQRDNQSLFAHVKLKIFRQFIKIYNKKRTKILINANYNAKYRNGLKVYNRDKSTLVDVSYSIKIHVLVLLEVLCEVYAERVRLTEE